MEPRLKPGLWVRSTIRVCEIQTIPAVIVKKGDEDVGSVLVKVNRFTDGCRVFAGVTLEDGSRGWMSGTGDAPVDERTADEYIQRQLSYDPDLWVLEIEDQQGVYEIS